MSGPARSISCHQRAYLSADWEFCETSADSVDTPDAIGASLEWQKTTAPTTAAASLRSLKHWSLDEPARRFDASDWWYRCRFAAPTSQTGSTTVLGLDGLATVAEVWLNGVLIVASENMFVAHEVIVDKHLRDNNELIIRFRALDKLLIARRPRPRWRAPMIENQQLRWFRTTLLGRTPGWSPPAAAVGPWRPVWLEQRQHFSVEKATLNATVAGDMGSVAVDLRFAPLGNTKLVSAQIIIERNGQEHVAEVDLKGSPDCVARISIPKPDLWWPHTHGEPALYTAKVAVTLNDGSVHEASLGSIGFRTVTLNTDNGDFKLSVNSVPIFCRGACWTPIDPVTLGAEPSQYAHAIQQVRDAGMNMLRISGTMVYESDEFLDLCDSNGILLWQDFMFANMDYPEEEKFVASTTTEIRQQLAKLSSRPCLAVLCGNSEVEQQAAMWGATREYWTPRLFHETIAELTKTLAPGVPYWPSSAHGGSLPYQGDVGTTSYYGVGAYLRPLEDARRSELKFATECLAFANIPDEYTLSKMPHGLALRTHHPEWKARTPRDLGAGWDFEDVRDHYLQQLCGITPAQLRYSDHDRYMALSRVAIGELMANTFGEWRRKDSRCNGAIIWLLRDLWPGAGWGIVDSLGRPKANYYYLRRALQPISIAITDEGCNGLYIHLCNELHTDFCGTIILSVHKADGQPTAQVARDMVIAAGSKISIPAASLLDAFYDLSYAYRFGPPASDYVVATLMSSDQKVATEYVHVRALQELIQKRDIGLSASAVVSAPGFYALTLKSHALALAVTIEADGYQCEDQYFNLAPGRERTLVLRSADNTFSKPFKANVTSINSHRSVPVDVRT